MAINYPTSLDSFTDPTGSDDLSTGPHSTLHTDERSAIEELEKKVGVTTRRTRPRPARHRSSLRLPATS